MNTVEQEAREVNMHPNLPATPEKDFNKWEQGKKGASKSHRKANEVSVHRVGKSDALISRTHFAQPEHTGAMPFEYHEPEEMPHANALDAANHVHKSFGGKGKLVVDSDKDGN